MKRFIATIVISFVLAVISAEDMTIIRKRIIPIVYTIEKLPRYWRKKALKIKLPRFFSSSKFNYISG